MATFTRTVYLQRFVRATTDATAIAKAHQGLALATRSIEDPYASIASIGIESTTATQVAGGTDVWQVEICVLAQLTSFDAFTATEAAGKLVTLDPAAAAADVYESDVSVVEDDESNLPLAG